ncbi:MAG: tetratricopeptide repeat protein [Bacteroidales bacterium]|nr:tetratricopeptide repeat protein [Bacteroidales bacterium]
MRIVFFFFLGSASLPCLPQNPVIDSLKQRLGQVEGEERIRVLIGLSYNFLRISVDESLEYGRQALDYSERSGNRRGVARALNMIGVGHSSAGDYESALSYHGQALDIFTELHDSVAMGITHNNIGVNFKKQGDYSQAVNHYENAYEIALQLGDRKGIHYALNNLGNVYFDWAKYDRAREYFSLALEISREQGDLSAVAIALNNIGETYNKMQDWDQALSHYRKSLRISRETGARKGILNSLMNIGEIYVHIDKQDTALRYFLDAIGISRELGDQTNYAYASIKAGEFYMNDGNYEKAIGYLLEGLEVAGGLNEPKLEKDVNESLSEYYRARGDFRAALDHYMRFTELKDTLFNRESRQEINELETKYETRKKEDEIRIQQLTIEKQQTRFTIGVIFFALIALTAYLLFNRYQLKQKNYRAELERKNIEIEQRLLRTQMNPHFIFNSLNSINSFIAGNNPDAAREFLTKFARLMRYILENSRKSFVPVEDEVNTLQLNMELERLRFSNKFDFTIHVEEGIDTECTFIPPMLVQPFIENAIIHGVGPKEGQGHISVSLSREDGLMLCAVEDDGIGRKKAMELREKAGKPGHKSLGMQVTKERIDLLTERTGKTVSVQIIDLADDQGRPSGTRIELRIPFEVE